MSRGRCVGVERRGVRLICLGIGILAFVFTLSSLAAAAVAEAEKFLFASGRSKLVEVEPERTEASAEAVPLEASSPVDRHQEEPSKKGGEARPTGNGPLYRFHVQVSALADRTDALKLAKRLATSYPYSVLVDPVQKSGKTLYRVRFRVPTRADAEALAERLRKEEGFKPWIVKAD